MKPLNRRTYGIAAICLAIVIFFALNIAVDTTFTTARVDLTQNGQFTLAKGTRNIIAKLTEPVTLKFYFSKKIAADYAQTNAYSSRVRDLLREYVALGHGNVIVQEIDPEPFTPEEDEASAAGLTPAPTDSGEQVYFGLVGTNRIDGREVVAYFAPDREPYLEYDLTSLIYRLSTPKKHQIGVVSSLPLDTGPGGPQAAMQGQSQPFAIYQELTQSYDTQMLDAGFKRIPANIDVLMIVHPTSLNPTQLYAIDQFVLDGGHALVFVDPYSELSQAGQGMDQQGGSPGSDLPKLFAAWGLNYSPEKIVGDKSLAQRVEVSADSRNPVASYPIWLHLTSDNFARDDTVTSNLQSVNLASAGALSPKRGATTVFAPLMTSSDQASLLDAADVRFNPRPQDLMGSINPTGEHYAIAARVTGPARTAFPAGPPPDMIPVPAGSAPPPPFPPGLKESHEPIDVIIVADSDIFDDRFWVHEQSLFGKTVAAPFADNAAFVLNAVENLTGSSDLISLRTRATNDRPFTVVRDLQVRAQAQFQQEAETLQQRLTDTEQRLHDIEQGGTTNGRASKSTVLTPEQQAAIVRFKQQLADTRTQLRDVQHNLRKDIDHLGNILAFVNIALIPLVVSGFALLIAALRRRRRARAVGA
jgi:ABC-type uncharacterized transport system involved in gliding motility auxiliary subunit